MKRLLLISVVMLINVQCGEDAPPKMYTLNIDKAGSGGGYVDIGGNKCQTFPCSYQYPEGEKVSLTAVPDAKSIFIGWSGDISDNSKTTTVTMDKDKNIIAYFRDTTKPMYNLTVSKTGTGASGGTITSTPPGINCGTDCSEQFEEGTSVTLEATTNGNVVFEGWSGDCSGSYSTCTVYMDGDKNVVAEFRDASIPQYTLTVVKNGEGLVTSNPAGISCGIDCSEAYDTGTVVTLTASPAAGYLFSGWEGDCSGTSTSCTVTMSTDRTVIANFSEAPPIFFDHFDYTSASELLNSGWSYGGGNASGAVVGVSNSFVYAANYGSGSGWHGVEIVAQLDSTIDVSGENFELSAYVSGTCSNNNYDDGVIEIGVLDNLNTRIAAIIWAQGDNCCVDYDIIDDGYFYSGNILAILPDGSFIHGNNGDYSSIAGTITIKKEAGIMGLYFNNTLVSSAAFSGSGVISKIRVRIYKYGDYQPCPTLKVDWVRVKKLP